MPAPPHLLDSAAGDAEGGPSRVRNVKPEELAFDAVYVRHFSDVCRWVAAFGCPSADVDDLAQEVFLIVRKKLAGFAGGNLPGFIYRISQRVVSDYRRRSWFRRLLRRTSDDPDALPAAADGPAEVLGRVRAERLLHEALSQMSAKRRAAFYLFEVEGYTGEEIAALEDVSVTTVYTRLHHARKQFLAYIAKVTEEPWSGS
jgi:RNA polymerase sigma-70 factor (ECF subfamily)